MFLKKMMKKSIPNSLSNIKELIKDADAVLVGIGAGMSAAGGADYSGERFEKYFGDFKAKYGIADMYSGGFYPFKTKEEYWAWWSRAIWLERYQTGVLQPYKDLLELVKDKNYFVLTTNVDHQVQKAGFDKKRLFYTQGDYGLFQCEVPCKEVTYDNEELVKEMVEKQKDMKIPTELIPKCPNCGKNLVPNLRIDATFVEDECWHKASERYLEFVEKNKNKKIVFLEFGIGMNTPTIIKYPFLRMTLNNKQAKFVGFNAQEFTYPAELDKQVIQVTGDIAENLTQLIEAN